MADKKEKPPLAKAEDVASAKSLLEAVAKGKERLTAVRAATTKDGKFDKYNLKYRQAHKVLKRAQRHLKCELIRVTPKHPPKEVPEPAEEAVAEKPAES